MNRTLQIAGGALAGLGLLGLVLIAANSQGNDMTPQQAKERVTTFAEDTIAFAAPGRKGTLEHAEGLRGSCHDRFGALINKTSRSYTWALEDVDDVLADQIVTRTGQLWREQGIEITRDDWPRGVNILLGSTDEDGFGYKLTVNRNERMAWVTIQTPCLDEGSA